MQQLTYYCYPQHYESHQTHALRHAVYTRCSNCLLLGMEANEYCVGCGEGIKNDRHRRLLQSEVSQHVIPLSMHMEGKGETNSGQLVRAGARMCRRCFSAYDRCTKQITLLRKSISKVLDNGSESDNCNTGDPPLPPPPKRLAISVGPFTASPDVMVGKHEQHILFSVCFQVQVNYQKKQRLLLDTKQKNDWKGCCSG